MCIRVLDIQLDLPVFATAQAALEKNTIDSL